MPTSGNGYKCLPQGMVRNLGHIHTMKYYTVIKIVLMESFNDGDFIIYINWERIQNCVYMY